MHSPADIRAVREMLDSGASDYAVAGATGVSRATVQRWRRRGFPQRVVVSSLESEWAPPEPGAYAYLLGLYLGDGHINLSPGRTPVLRITNDSGYPRLIEEGTAAMAAVFPDAVVRRYVFPAAGKTVLHVCHAGVLPAFPQHGRGKKHERRIRLKEWQCEITAVHAPHFLRGLLHSDGCRSINRVKTRLPSGRDAIYEYPRYYFTNYSADIRELFRDHCALLGIRATQSNFKTISVANRPGVAILDSFVGPKS